MSVEQRRLTLRSGLRADVLVKGEGKPLVFLHGHLGRQWDSFQDALAQHHTVFAPRHPGGEDPDELMKLDGFSDLALYYDDLIGELGIERPVVVGHSFGGMVAAELVATHPEKISALILLAPLGLWKDDEPVTDIGAVPAEGLPALLFADPGAEEAKTLFALPSDPQEAGRTALERMLSVASVSHFIWPIPDRDLARRLYRITPPTLLVWGSDDRFVPPSYAETFAAGLPSARISMLEGAGHFVQLERRDEVTRVVKDFLSETGGSRE